MADQYNFSDVFVSYAREDSEFVNKVVHILFDRGYEVWIDWDDIPHTVDWWKEICAGIDASNTFIAVLTKDYANSEVCYREVQYAIENNKRIVPVIPDEFEEDGAEHMHPAIKSANWFRFKNNAMTFGENVDRVVELINMDVDYLRLHTRYLVRAREWLQRGKDKSFLLRGLDSIEAQDWLDNSGDKVPRPMQLQMDYVNACSAQLQEDRELSRQKQSILFIDRTTIPTVAIVVLMVWYYSAQTFPKELAERTLMELTFGISGTGGILIAVLILYGDVLVRLRYPHHPWLRLGSSFVFSLIVGMSFSGFIQAIFFESQLHWGAVVANGFLLSLAPILGSTFLLRGWQCMLIAFVLTAFGIQWLHVVDYQLGSQVPFAIYHFKTEAQADTLGYVMAGVLALAMYITPLINDLIRLYRGRNQVSDPIQELQTVS